MTTRADIVKLRERQQELAQQGRTAYLDQINPETPEAEVREAHSKFDQYMAEFDRLEAQIADAERLLNAEERANQGGGDPSRRPGARSSAQAEDPEQRAQDPNAFEWDAEHAFRRAMQYGYNQLPQEARALLTTVSQNELPAELRAQATSPDSAGGVLVPEGFIAEVVKTMALWGPMMEPDFCRDFPTPGGGRLPIPTLDDTANEGDILAENAAEGEQDLTMGEKAFDAYKVSSDIIRVSFELDQDSAIDVDGIIQDAFGERLARKANGLLTTGTGSSQPNGIVTASSLGVTAASASAVTFDEVMDLHHSVDPAYRASPKFRYQFNDTTLLALRKLKDGQGNYLWQSGDVRGGVPATINDKPYRVNQAMAGIATGNRSIICGDHGKYGVRRVRAFTMLRLVERYAENWQIGFIAMIRIDGEALDTSAIKHLIQA